MGIEIFRNIGGSSSGVASAGTPRVTRVEVGTAPIQTNLNKAVVLAESRTSGVLRQIWFAAGQGSTASDGGFLLTQGAVRVYIDDPDTPAFTIPMGSFFPAVDLGSNFHSPAMGRADGNGQPGAGSGYRFLHAPFQGYMRVEIVNTSATEKVFYGHAAYTERESNTMRYSMANTVVPVVTPYSYQTILDVQGSGQVEHVMAKYLCSPSTQAGLLEGDVEVWVDGVLAQRYSGIEDFFLGGWYKGHKSGYPAGTTDEQSSAGYMFYRYFDDDPIVFKESVKIIVGLGQRNQGSIAATPAMGFSATAGYWVRSGGHFVSPRLSDPLHSIAWNNGLGSWQQPGDRTQMVSVSEGVQSTITGQPSDQDVRLFNPTLDLGSDYFVSTKVKIRGTQNGQEAFLGAAGAYDPYYGSAVHVQLRRDSQYSWKVFSRDDFNTFFIDDISGGKDLTGTWVWLGIAMNSGRVTTYYSMDGVVWNPQGTWMSTKSGTSVCVGTWEASATFTDFKAYKLLEVER